MMQRFYECPVCGGENMVFERSGRKNLYYCKECDSVMSLDEIMEMEEICREDDDYFDEDNLEAGLDIWDLEDDFFDSYDPD